ncbi:MAG: ATP-binding protein, partial [Chitinophagaceae bacterium]|nr:ATP-binding protein [Chitinophagaceae bacterium]
MEALLDNEIVRSYKRLSYTHWHALAEFVDNSTQAYLDNRSVLDLSVAPGNFRLSIVIKYIREEDRLIIFDNSIGMSEAELERAMKIGMPPDDTSGRSRYGLGMKTAACWFGDLWELETKKLGETNSAKIIFDVDRVAQGDRDLRLTRESHPVGEHFTKIEIQKLNRKFAGRTITKIKDYLRSFYRKDIHRYLDLYWGEEKLNWDDRLEIEEDLIKHNGAPLKYEFQFEVNGKDVTGWAGVFLRGGRSKAGFAMLHNDRVIRGWPDSYRPESIFGEQRNDLINQRLVGELDLGAFDISHTKDQILFSAD